MKVTRLEWPVPLDGTWSGEATDEAGNYSFYYRRRGRFAVMKQDAREPTSWFYVEPPEWLKPAVLKAIRALRLDAA